MSAALPHNGYPDSIWDAVRAMWMAGNSASSIAQKDGMPSKQAICVRAKDEAWERIDAVDPALELIPFDGLDERKRFVVMRLAEGLRKKDAAALAGIHASTLSDWLKDDAKFANAALAAVAVKNARRLRKVEQAEDWKASTWLLERDLDTREDYGAPKQASPAAFNFNVLGHVQVGLERLEAEQPALIGSSNE